MSLTLKILLIIGAALLFAYVLHKIRKATIQATDTIFWLIACLVLILLAIFPSISYFFSDLLGIQSPANFVFLMLICVLIVRVFMSSMEISQLNIRLNTMAQKVALQDKDGIAEERTSNGRTTSDEPEDESGSEIASESENRSC